MKFDLTFPNYANRMIKCVLVLCVIGSGLLFAWKGWPFGVAFMAGSLFHVLFFKLLLLKFNQWVRDEKPADFMGQRLFVFTSLRFILEIAMCVAVIFSPFNVLAFLGGLLTLPVATIVERIGGLIKE